jgi:hypothetical protein
MATADPKKASVTEEKSNGQKKVWKVLGSRFEIPNQY